MSTCKVSVKILRAIVISSLSIPALVFFVFLAAGLVFLVSELVGSGKYSNGWLGIVYAGAVYTYLAALVSTIPTIVLGLPTSLIASKYGILNSRVILVGAVIIGGIYLGVSSLLFFKAFNLEIFLWSVLAGGCGGMFNGYILLRVVNPEKTGNET